MSVAEHIGAAVLAIVLGWIPWVIGVFVIIRWAVRKLSARGVRRVPCAACGEFVDALPNQTLICPMCGSEVRA